LTGFSFVGIGSAVATVEALKRSGKDLSRERFIEEMNKLRDFKTGILAGGVTFTPQDHQGAKMSAAAGFVDGKPVLFESWGKRLNPPAH
jgi:branched-chain amino acid transport system substrate-binding protein